MMWVLEEEIEPIYTRSCDVNILQQYSPVPIRTQQAGYQQNFA